MAFNQDGSLNSDQNPAAASSVVILYATGEGLTNPSGEDGAVTTGILRTPQLPVSLKIGGQTADVVYAGSAPSMVSSILQVEAIVPNGAGTGEVPVVLTVGTAGSQAGVTVALK